MLQEFLANEEVIVKVKSLTEENIQQAQHTLPGLFKKDYESYRDRKVCMRRKKLGIWHEYSWDNCYKQIKYLSLAMVNMGMKPGDKVAIIGDSAPEYFWAEYAIMSLGATAVPIYAGALPTEVQYIVEHSDSKFVFVSDQEQADKLLLLKEQGHIVFVTAICYWDAKGLWSYEDPMLYSFDKIVGIGRKYEDEHPGLFEQNLEDIKPEDPALLVYTSGTTDLPKGVMLSHKHLLINGVAILLRYRCNEIDNVMSCTSPAWIMEQLISVVLCLLSNAVLNFSEAPETINEDMREISPNIVLFSARQWEDIVSKIQVRIDGSGPLQRILYQMSMPINYKVADMEEQGRKIPFLWKSLRTVAFWICFRPLLDKFALINARHAWVTGAYFNPEAFRFIRAIGVPLKELYGLTETLVVTSHSHKVTTRSGRRDSQWRGSDNISR